MQLAEVLERLDSFPSEDTIYAALVDGQWQLRSTAVVAPEPSDGALTQEFDGVLMEYLLEIFLAIEVVTVWSDWNRNPNPTPEEKLRAIVFYRLNDAYLPADE